MKPKEKAEQLLIYYYNTLLELKLPSKDHRRIAKKSAMTCVLQVIEQWDYIDTYLADLGGELNPNLKYWYEVKAELNAL